MTSGSILPKRPDLTPAHVKWRVDSKPRQDGRHTIARFVAWLSQERLADMLDVWVGPENWFDTYTLDGKFIWCTITITTPDGRNVQKVDVGDTGQSLKNATTDAFKRCATRKWGLGREVRHIPTLWAPCRTYTNNSGEQVAVANTETRPTLNRKLADLGFAGWSTEVEDGPDDTAPNATSAGPQPANPPTPPPRDETPTIKSSIDELADWIEQHGRRSPNRDTARKIDMLRIVAEITSTQQSTPDPTGQPRLPAGPAAEVGEVEPGGDRPPQAPSPTTPTPNPARAARQQTRPQ